jgi:ABC-type transport system involved in cytochrome bd biosynthesis fused ATPase/permease subunit
VELEESQHTGGYSKIATAAPGDIELVQRENTGIENENSLKLAETATEVSAHAGKAADTHVPGKFSFALKIPLFETRTPNELIAVVGSVGSGKSSFISTVLGEIPLRSTVQAVQIAGEGAVTVHGPISYCAQTPWIQNMSLRNNVLFGLHADESVAVQSAYEGSLSAACLLPDLRILPDGDQTESKSVSGLFCARF